MSYSEDDEYYDDDEYDDDEYDDEEGGGAGLVIALVSILLLLGLGTIGAAVMLLGGDDEAPVTDGSALPPPEGEVVAAVTPAAEDPWTDPAAAAGAATDGVVAAGAAPAEDPAGAADGDGLELSGDLEVEPIDPEPVERATPTPRVERDTSGYASGRSSASSSDSAGSSYDSGRSAYDSGRAARSGSSRGSDSGSTRSSGYDSGRSSATTSSRSTSSDTYSARAAYEDSGSSISINSGRSSQPVDEEPDVEEDEPRVVEDEPRVVEDEPRVEEDEPRIEEDEPRVVDDEPRREQRPTPPPVERSYDQSFLASLSGRASAGSLSDDDLDFLKRAPVDNPSYDLAWATVMKNAEAKRDWRAHCEAVTSIMKKPGNQHHAEWNLEMGKCRLRNGDYKGAVAAVEITLTDPNGLSASTRTRRTLLAYQVKSVSRTKLYDDNAKANAGLGDDRMLMSAIAAWTDYRNYARGVGDQKALMRAERELADLNARKNG